MVADGTGGSRLIFIGGVHRSGTSLLHRLLSSHPSFSGFADTGVPEDEGQHLQDVYPTAKSLGGPGGFGFNDASFMDESHPLATPANARRLLECWKPYWDLDAPYLLEKSPPNLVRTRFFQALFPDCRFVIAVRHPVAVAYATRKWSRTRIPGLIQHTLRCYQRFVEDAPYLKRVYVIRYEAFVEDSAAEVGRLLEWLEAEPRTIDEVSIRPGLNERYFAKWERDRGSQIKRLVGETRGLRSLLPALEAEANALGYSVERPEELQPVRLPHERGSSGGKGEVPAASRAQGR